MPHAFGKPDHSLVLDADQGIYFVAVVTATGQWFDGPHNAEEAAKTADRYNRDPYRNAVVIGVRS